jgi:hypothetical protein
MDDLHQLQFQLQQLQQFQLRQQQQQQQHQHFVSEWGEYNNIPRYLPTTQNHLPIPPSPPPPPIPLQVSSSQPLPLPLPLPAENSSFFTPSTFSFPLVSQSPSFSSSSTMSTKMTSAQAPSAVALIALKSEPSSSSSSSSSSSDKPKKENSSAKKNRKKKSSKKNKNKKNLTVLHRTVHQRLIWTTELEYKFMRALRIFGVQTAKPKGKSPLLLFLTFALVRSLASSIFYLFVPALTFFFLYSHLRLHEHSRIDKRECGISSSKIQDETHPTGLV